MAAKPTGNPLGRLSMSAKIVVGVVLVGIVAAVYLVVFFADIDGRISEAVGAEQTARGNLQKAEEAKIAYQRDVEDKTRRQQLERERRKVLPDEAETPSFLAAVQGVATTSGVSLTKYQPEDEISDQYYVRVPMSLELSGRFHQVARFFSGVGQLDRVINIEDIEITQSRVGAAESSEIILNVKCLATAFRAKKAGEGEAVKGQRGRR